MSHTISLRLEGSHACTSQRVPSHLGHSSSTGSLGTSSEGDLVELSRKSRITRRHYFISDHAYPYWVSPLKRTTSLYLRSFSRTNSFLGVVGV